MTARLRLFLGVALVTAAAASAFAQPPDLALMPPDGFAGTWKRAGTPRTFTSADLYGHINGGAELFLELGFEQLTVQRYKDGVDEIAIETYRMTDATAARAVYLTRRGKETPEPAFKARHTVSRHQLQFQRDRYYVIVNNLGGHATAMPSLVTAAQFVAKAIPADGTVPALALLPKAGLVAGSERLIRGAFTLQAVFTLGEGDVLSLAGKLTAVSGEYRTAAAAFTVVIVDYPTPAAATAALDSVKKHLDSYLKPLSATATRLVFQDFEKKYGVATVTGKRLEVRLRLAQPPA